MLSSPRLSRTRSWATDRSAAARERFDLSPRAFILVVAALGLVAVAVLLVATLALEVLWADGLTANDPGTLQRFMDLRRPSVNLAASNISVVGSIVVLIPVSVVASVALWSRGVPRLIAGAPILSLAVTGLFVNIGKVTIDRPRPPLVYRLAVETNGSFPSGHSADSAAVYLTLAFVIGLVGWRQPAARIATVLVASLLTAAIGATRLVLGVHWPTDVAAGWALGTTVAILVTVVTFLASRRVPPPPVDGATVTTGQRLHRYLVTGRVPSSAAESSGPSVSTGPSDAGIDTPTPPRVSAP